MTRTSSTKVVSLSNTTSQTFKSELLNTQQQTGKTDLIKTSDGLFNCALKLPDKSFITIPMREDGYINATLLCKAGGKKFNDWNRLKNTNELITVLESETGNPVSQLIDVNKGNSSKYEQGSWIHPDLAIQLAQWLSPSFALQVSRWTRELLLFGSVTLGQEKSNKELEEKFQQKIQSLQQTIETVVNENLKIKSTYSHLAELHDQIRMKRNYHKFKKGNCLYIITDRWREKEYLKIGYTDNINTRLQTYRTSMPDVKINFLLYLTENKFLEKCLKVRYAAKLVEKNHEYVIDATSKVYKYFNKISTC